jgi:hypothetical protein
MLRCGLCDQKTEVQKIDTSFSHLKGLEKSFFFGSKCCHETVFLDGYELTQVNLESLWDWNQDHGEAA